MGTTQATIGTKVKSSHDNGYRIGRRRVALGHIRLRSGDDGCGACDDECRAGNIGSEAGVDGSQVGRRRDRPRTDESHPQYIRASSLVQDSRSD